MGLSRLWLLGPSLSMSLRGDLLFQWLNPWQVRSVGNTFVKVWPYVVSLGIISGFLREGIRWLLMRFAVRTVWSWEEGVFFGICS